MPVSVTKAMDKWATATSGASEAVKDGVRSTNKDPIQLAIAAKDKWIQNTQRAASEGRFEKGLGKSSKAEWQAAMIDKGASNMANGVRSLRARSRKKMEDVINYTQTVSDQVAAMPSTTEADMDARALKAIQLMRDYKKRQ